MNKELLGAVAAISFVLSPAAGQAAMIVIDEFSTIQRVEDPPSIDPTNSEVMAPEALGGWRDLAVTRKAGGIGENTTLNGGGEILSFSNDDETTGIGFIVYDGNDGDATTIDIDGLGGIDFLIGAAPFFNFDVVTFESNLDVTINAWDMDGATTTYFETLPPAGAFSPVLPLTDFSNPAFDWTRVGALEFQVESNTAGYDGSIDSITLQSTIPLPAPAFLMLGGLGALSLARFRHKA